MKSYRFSPWAGLLVLLCSLGAQAQEVVGARGEGEGSSLTLATTVSGGACGSAATCTLGSSFAITEGAVFTGTNSDFLPLPAGAPEPEAWLSVAPGGLARVDFGDGFSGGVSSVTFLWGTPNAFSSDAYDAVEVFTTGGAVTVFDTSAASLDFPIATTFGDVPQFVHFESTGDNLILALVFVSHDPENNFEVADFKTTAAIPEPQTYELLLAGLGITTVVARRREKAQRRA